MASENDPPRITLAEGQSALFGYGSLMSKASLEKTLGRPYTNAFVECSIAGWQRTWTAGIPNQIYFCDDDNYGCYYPASVLYLNVEPEETALTNGILFLVSAEEMAAFDKREWCYDRISVTNRLSGVQVTGGEAFVYSAQPDYLVRGTESPRVAAICRSYIDIVETGLGERSEGFRSDYIRTTIPAEHLIIADMRTL